MATARLSMRKVREILRQKWVLQRTHREAHRSLGVSLGVVSDTLARAKKKQLDWATVEKLSDEELEALLYVRPSLPTAAARQRPLPDPVYIHNERKKAGVTLELLHLEYVEKHPDGYRYSQFCEHYRRWVKQHPVLTMRQVHRAGEKLFVDYSGMKPHYVDPKTGVPVEVELFVAVLGASNYIYAEATRTQSSPDWIGSHTRLLAFLGGVPAMLVPDQLKSGVTVPSRYEPGVQRTYAELASHYDTTVVPARPKHPRDKAKVEVGVLIAQRWVLARLRHQTFFSLEELNARIAELVEELNARTMKIYGGSRRDLFERIDRPALKPLPSEPFVYAEWLTVRVNVDYHVEVDHHFYSVPHTLVHARLEARMAAMTVEVFVGQERIAAHPRSFVRGRHTTNAEHMPKAHQKHLEWTPSRILHWARSVGPQTEALAAAILADRPHPEQGYRSCLGILRLGKQYGAERLEAACARALRAAARSYRHVAAILKNRLDDLPLPTETADLAAPPLTHENLRGSGYYH